MADTCLVAITFQCLPGEYLLYLRVIPPKRLSTSQSQVVVDTYSEQPVDLTFLPFAEMWQRIQPSLSTLTIENGKTETYQEWSAPLVSVTRWQSSAIGVSCIIYENQPGSSVSLHEEVVLQLNNLELLDANGEEGVPSDAQVAIAIDLAPGESRMLVFRQIDNGYSFSLGYSRSFSLRDHC